MYTPIRASEGMVLNINSLEMTKALKKIADEGFLIEINEVYYAVDHQVFADKLEKNGTYKIDFTSTANFTGITAYGKSTQYFQLCKAVFR